MMAMSLRDFCEPGDTYTDLAAGTTEVIPEETEDQGEVQVRSTPTTDNWRPAPWLAPESIGYVNQTYGWEKFRLAESAATPDWIAEHAARTVLVENIDNLRVYAPDEDPIAALGWALGDGISYEKGLRQFARAVIEIKEKSA